MKLTARLSSGHYVTEDDAGFDTDEDVAIHLEDHGFLIFGDTVVNKDHIVYVEIEED